MTMNRMLMSKSARWGVFSRGLVVGLILALSGCWSSYYVKLVDQNGEPVSGATLTYSTLDGNPYFTSRDGHEITTNSEGMARLVAGGTNNFYTAKKEGYQFDLRRQINTRFGGSISGRYLSSHGRRNPLIIYAWKRGLQPDLKIVKGRIKLVNNGSPCVVKLLDHNGQAISLSIINELEWVEETRTNGHARTN